MSDSRPKNRAQSGIGRMRLRLHADESSANALRDRLMRVARTSLSNKLEQLFAENGVARPDQSIAKLEIRFELPFSEYDDETIAWLWAEKVVTAVVAGGQAISPVERNAPTEHVEAAEDGEIADIEGEPAAIWRQGVSRDALQVVASLRRLRETASVSSTDLESQVQHDLWRELIGEDWFFREMAVPSWLRRRRTQDVVAKLAAVAERVAKPWGESGKARAEHVHAWLRDAVAALQSAIDVPGESGDDAVRSSAVVRTEVHAKRRRLALLELRARFSNAESVCSSMKRLAEELRRLDRSEQLDINSADEATPALAEAEFALADMWLRREPTEVLSSPEDSSQASAIAGLRQAILEYWRVADSDERTEPELARRLVSVADGWIRCVQQDVRPEWLASIDHTSVATNEASRIALAKRVLAAVRVPLRVSGIVDGDSLMSALLAESVTGDVGDDARDSTPDGLRLAASDSLDAAEIADLALALGEYADVLALGPGPSRVSLAAQRVERAMRGLVRRGGRVGWLASPGRSERSQRAAQILARVRVPIHAVGIRDGALLTAAVKRMLTSRGGELEPDDLEVDLLEALAAFLDATAWPCAKKWTRGSSSEGLPGEELASGEQLAADDEELSGEALAERAWVAARRAEAAFDALRRSGREPCGWLDLAGSEVEDAVAAEDLIAAVRLSASAAGVRSGSDLVRAIEATVGPARDPGWQLARSLADYIESVGQSQEKRREAEGSVMDAFTRWRQERRGLPTWMSTRAFESGARAASVEELIAAVRVAPGSALAPASRLLAESPSADDATERPDEADAYRDVELALRLDLAARSLSEAARKSLSILLQQRACAGIEWPPWLDLSDEPWCLDFRMPTADELENVLARVAMRRAQDVAEDAAKAGGGSGPPVAAVGDSVSRVELAPLFVSRRSAAGHALQVDADGWLATRAAGLVLLHPFLPAACDELLSAIGIAGDEPDAWTARRSLLAWLCNSEEPFGWSTDPIVGLLAGAPRDRWGEQMERPHDEVRPVLSQVADAVLRSFAAAVPGLDGHGSAMIQTSFLLRQGRFGPAEASGRRVHMQAGPLDMLLRRGAIPLGMAMIPWIGLLDLEIAGS